MIKSSFISSNFVTLEDTFFILFIPSLNRSRAGAMVVRSQIIQVDKIIIATTQYISENLFVFYILFLFNRRLRPSFSRTRMDLRKNGHLSDLRHFHIRITRIITLSLA